MSGPKIFLTARWERLLMLNYETEPSILEPYVPMGTELDVWNECTLVSVVGFSFHDARVWGMPVPLHRNFEEVNLRFYVRRWDAGEWKRGVAFIREIVPRRLVALTARLLYNENYVALPMASSDGVPPSDSVAYSWRVRHAWHRLAARLVESPRASAAGSEEQFVTDHYWGYATQRDGGTVEYRVDHPAWQVRSVSHATLEGDVSEWCDPMFAETLAGPPRSAFVADGSEVTVSHGARIGAAGTKPR